MAPSPAPPLPPPEGAPILGKKGLTATRALLFVAGLTIAVVLVAAFVMRISDDQEFNTYGKSVWWAVQTVTTVGYGDIVPSSTLGRFVAGIVMLMGVAFISILSGVTASVLVESVRRKRGLDRRDELIDTLNAMHIRLARIEACISDPGAQPPLPGPSPGSDT